MVIKGHAYLNKLTAKSCYFWMTNFSKCLLLFIAMFCYLSKVTTLHPLLLTFVDVQLGYLLRNGLIFRLHLNLIATRSFIKNKTCTFFSDWNVRCTIWVTFGAISNFRLPCFRYVETNVCRSSLYRKYNEMLPQWLSNKPKKFDNHCIEKIRLAKCIQNITKYYKISQKLMKIHTSCRHQRILQRIMCDC